MVWAFGLSLYHSLLFPIYFQILYFLNMKLRMWWNYVDHANSICRNEAARKYRDFNNVARIKNENVSMLHKPLLNKILFNVNFQIFISLLFNCTNETEIFQQKNIWNSIISAYAFRFSKKNWFPPNVSNVLKR